MITAVDGICAWCRRPFTRYVLARYCGDDCQLAAKADREQTEERRAARAEARRAKSAARGRRSGEFGVPRRYAVPGGPNR
jgi:hypothetical protein